MSSGNKSRVFVLLPYLIILILLVGVELALRTWVPSLDNPIVVEKKYDNIEWYQISRGYLKKYFSANTPLVPEFKESLFRKTKKDNAYRIFCLGESSMFGVPYQMNANIPGILRKQLRHRYPEQEIEVVNWGASAINSNHILDLSKEIAQFKPDLICVYMGHNEFYGPEGVSASFWERWFPSLIPLKHRIRELRIMKGLLSWLSSSERTPPDLNLMQQVSGGNLVKLGSEEAEWVLGNFRANLSSLVRFWKTQNVPLIISDVSSNLMFPPFMAEEIPGQTQNEIVASFREGRFAETFQRLKLLEHSQPTNAFVSYWLGRCALEMQQPVQARVFLESARDNDLLKFRAPSPINESLRSICEQESVLFVSTDSLLAILSPNGIPGEEIFWEHLHPKVNGYYSIANLFATKITIEKLVKAKFVNATPAISYNADSLSIAWLDLAYADLSIRNLTSRWPFDNYKRPFAVLDSADDGLREIAFKTYSRTYVWDEACYKSAEYFWRKGNLNAARTTYEAVLEEYPTNFYAHYLLGNLLAKMDNVEAAIHHYNRSVQGNSEYPHPHVEAGLLLVNGGEFDGAIRQFRIALTLTNSESMKSMRATAYYGLGAAYANKSQYDEALKNLDAALSLAPTYSDALRLKDGILGHIRR